jgi:hypothetical protein
MEGTAAGRDERREQRRHQRAARDAATTASPEQQTKRRGPEQENVDEAKASSVVIGPEQSNNKSLGPGGLRTLCGGVLVRLLWRRVYSSIRVAVRLPKTRERLCWS